MILYIILGIILIINITTIILAVMSFKTSKNEYYSDDTIDFATIVFDNQRELNLLKLQAYSFKFVDKNLINKIYIFYQDSGKRDMKDVIAYYPEYLQDKVVVLYFDDMNFNKSITLMTNKELWWLQQYIKLYLAKLIEKEYYCVLDAKNHFIKNVGKKDFFTDDGKYYIFISDGCNTDGHHNFSKNSFKYFGIKPEYNISKKIFISMSTPFIFDKKQVIQMFNNIEKNEKTSFENWFLSKGVLIDIKIFLLILYSGFMPKYLKEFLEKLW